jgi:hypothetical protein
LPTQNCPFFGRFAFSDLDFDRWRPFPTAIYREGVMRTGWRQEGTGNEMEIGGGGDGDVERMGRVKKGGCWRRKDQVR